MTKPTRPDDPHNPNHPFSLTIVVSGDDIELRVKPDDVAGDVLEKALKKAKNDGKPASDWELKTEAGAALILTATLAQLGIAQDTVLFASLKAGAAG